MIKSKSRSGSLRCIRNEAQYERALVEIAPYFAREPAPGTRAADEFDLLALLIESYEKKLWPINPPERVDATP
jgi:HTH-type transcriptional regulator/antitoxin HigA